MTTTQQHPTSTPSTPSTPSTGSAPRGTGSRLLVSFVAGALSLAAVGGLALGVHELTSGRDSGSASAPVDPSGRSDPAVATVQRELAQLDYYSGPITGRMDDATAAAISDFQQWASTQSWGSGVSVTGQLDAATAAAIATALATGDNTMGG